MDWKFKIQYDDWLTSQNFDLDIIFVILMCCFIRSHNGRRSSIRSSYSLSQWQLQTAPADYTYKLLLPNYPCKFPKWIP